MQTLTQLKQDGYKFFNRQSPENKAKNIQILNYLDMLASQSGINMSSWDIEELFRDPKEKRSFLLIQDRPTVNKITFEHWEKIKSSTTDEIQAIEKMIRGPLKDFQTGITRQEMQRLRERRDQARTSAEQYAARMQSQIKDAYESEIKMDALSGAHNNPNAFSDMVVQILKDNFWRFEAFDGTFLQLSTSSDVVMQELNPAAGLNNRVNLGQFMAKLNVRDMTLTLHRHANNCVVDNMYHPYVASSGRICFGDASTQAAKALSTGNVKEVFDILSALLVNFGSGTPYIGLDKFMKVRGNMQISAPPPKDVGLAVEGDESPLRIPVERTVEVSTGIFD